MSEVLNQVYNLENWNYLYNCDMFFNVTEIRYFEKTTGGYYTILSQTVCESTSYILHYSLFSLCYLEPSRAF